MTLPLLEIIINPQAILTSDKIIDLEIIESTVVGLREQELSLLATNWLVWQYVAFFLGHWMVWCMFQTRPGR